jgi:hypothetical protein
MSKLKGFRPNDIVEVVDVSVYDANCGVVVGAFGYVLGPHPTLAHAYRITFVGLDADRGFPMFAKQLRKVGHAKVPRAR